MKHFRLESTLLLASKVASSGAVKRLTTVPATSLLTIIACHGCSTQQLNETFGSVQSTNCMESSGLPDCDPVQDSLYDRTPRAGMPDLYSNEALEAQAENLKD